MSNSNQKTNQKVLGIDLGTTKKNITLTINDNGKGIGGTQDQRARTQLGQPATAVDAPARKTLARGTVVDRHGTGGNASARHVDARVQGPVGEGDVIAVPVSAEVAADIPVERGGVPGRARAASSPSARRSPR